VLSRVILLGSDYYESLESILEHEESGTPRIGIGANCRIENTIVDKNARIGNNVVISPAGQAGEGGSSELLHSRRDCDHSKNGVIPHGMVI